ncbi:MAG: acylphosphatase [Methanosarcinaceae archaeon]|nr:acylphosphatase [Methanosarcinaceae archaeon]
MEDRVNDQACAEIYVSGRVQGVYYRGFTQSVAMRLGIVGYAQNLPDGRVKVIAQGDRQNVRELLDNLKIGPRLADVHDVNVQWHIPVNTLNETGFSIRR